MAALSCQQHDLNSQCVKLCLRLVLLSLTVIGISAFVVCHAQMRILPTLMSCLTVAQQHNRLKGFRFLQLFEDLNERDVITVVLDYILT